MNLAQLEQAEKLIRLSHFLVSPLEEVFRRNGEGVKVYLCVQHLLDACQFYVLLQLKRAEQHAYAALDALTVDTEYLRCELEQQLQGLGVLLQKMEREEHLRRDREVLLSPVAEEVSQGVGEWTSGKPSG